MTTKHTVRHARVRARRADPPGREHHPYDALLARTVATLRALRQGVAPARASSDAPGATRHVAEADLARCAEAIVADACRTLVRWVEG